MEFHIIGAKDIDLHWQILLPYINSFIENPIGRFDSEDVLSEIKKGRLIIWVLHDDSELKTVLITQVVDYPKIKELQIIMCIGEDYKGWYSLVISKLEEYAKMIGCKKISAFARPGWEKVMVGYKKSHVYLERDL